LIAQLDAFAHTVAHGLKNPLSIVAAHIELLKEDWMELLLPNHSWAAWRATIKFREGGTVR
jgi:light-regulated signal transduction histidine kinase (bacteriophytochrome)